MGAASEIAKHFKVASGRNLTSRLVLPDGLEGPAFIVYANFDATLRWNRSNYFALAVGALSDAMAYSR